MLNPVYSFDNYF